MKKKPLPMIQHTLYASPPDTRTSAGGRGGRGELVKINLMLRYVYTSSLCVSLSLTLSYLLFFFLLLLIVVKVIKY